MRDYPHRFVRQLILCAALPVVATLAVAAPLPVLTGLSSYTRKVTTSSAAAQRYFDQGVAFTHGFDHERAIESFQEAVKLDPQCAMAWWGIANACGPNINAPEVDEAHFALARNAIVKAQAAAGTGTAAEQALITAQAKRYGAKYTADRKSLDEAYAAAMREAWHAHPEDADLGVLFAESLLDLRPWDQWKADGSPQPGTEEALAALKVALSASPDHPLGLHLTIHTIEAGPQPELAVPASDRLRQQRTLIGHIEHMPSHIDVLVGRWAEAVESNQRAVFSDGRYRQQLGLPPGGLIAYMAHNSHMLAYAAMMTGESAVALRAIREMIAGFPAQPPVEIAGMVEGFSAMQYEVMLRFGRWEEILALPAPAENAAFGRSLFHAARGIAHAALGHTVEARAEQKAFAAVRKNVPAKANLSINRQVDILQVADAMLDGELLFREGKSDQGLARLREAVKQEDALHYDEPPGWIVPVRHALGAALLQVGRLQDAERVYREDLQKRPRNGWSLFGLARSLKLQGKSAEAAATEREFRAVWSRADIELKSSCLCQPGA